MQFYIDALNELDLSWIILINITKVLAFIGIGLSKPYNLKNKQKSKFISTAFLKVQPLVYKFTSNL